MKKIFEMFVVLALAFITGCSSLGVATIGANYFNGKKEADLVKYFKYDGEPVKADSDYDKVLRFSNLVTTVYVDKTTVEKFKNRRYASVSNLNFYKLYDGCYIYPETFHIQDFKWNGRIDETVTQDVPQSASRDPMLQSQGRGIRTHRNNNTEINSKIKSFDSLVQQYGAVKKNNDNIMFEKTNINGTYYIYDIQSNRFQYSDNEETGATATEYKYLLQSVSVYEDSKSSTETHTAYIYNDRENTYTDEKGNLISEADAFSKENQQIFLDYLILF